MLGSMKLPFFQEKQATFSDIYLGSVSYNAIFFMVGEA
jgi:hypothetical protein